MHKWFVGDVPFHMKFSAKLTYPLYITTAGGTACVIECRGRVDKSISRYGSAWLGQCARFAFISAYRISDGGVRDDARRCLGHAMSSISLLADRKPRPMAIVALGNCSVLIHKIWLVVVAIRRVY